MKKSLFLLPILAAAALAGCGPNNGPKELKLTINYAKIAEQTGSKTGYDAVGAITSIDGYEVSFTNVCINNLNSKSQPQWTTPNDAKVQVVQFKNPKTAAGVISFTNVKVTKVTINLLSSYAVDNDFKVTIGNAVATMTADAGAETTYESGVGEKTYPIKKYALSFAASGEGDLVINNQGSGARYLESIVIE